MKLPSIDPEVVGLMPEQMFTDIQDVIPVDDPSENYRGYTVRWDPIREFKSMEGGMLLDRVDPMTTRILEIETKKIKFIDFSIANGIILPGEVQRDGSAASWHRDGDLLDRAHRYVTANTLPTEIKGMPAIQPYQLVRLGRAIHRSPVNLLGTEIKRTWVRAQVFY